MRSRGGGTRFRLFPQPPFGGPGREPEVVTVSSPAGGVGPGPQDGRMYVVEPVGKRRNYGIAAGTYGTPFLYLPPWDGRVGPPAVPDEAGHFDRLEVGTRAFEMAHLFGTVRFVLDVWEGYFRRRIPWHFAPEPERLELSLLPSSDNAFAGYGFLEVGAHRTDDGDLRPFSLNFDVVAHEVGHLIIYSEVGLPTDLTAAGEYYGFHESAADLVALIAALHFDSVVDRLLATTSGNLYVLNELNRFAELSDNEEIRIASNATRLSEFAAGWRKEHDLSEPLTGALFDVLVDIFHEGLLDRRLIDPAVEDLADRVQRVPEYEPLIQALFDDAYGRDPAGFREALLDARDILGSMLAEAWRRLSPHFLDYEGVAGLLVQVDRDLTGGRYRRLIRENVLWRGIGLVRVGPRLAPPDGGGNHAASPRTAVPGAARHLPRMPYRERWELARRGGPLFD